MITGDLRGSKPWIDPRASKGLEKNQRLVSVKQARTRIRVYLKRTQPLGFR